LHSNASQLDHSPRLAFEANWGGFKVASTGLNWTGLDWTRLDWTGLDWTRWAWDWTGAAAAFWFIGPAFGVRKFGCWARAAHTVRHSGPSQFRFVDQFSCRPSALCGSAPIARWPLFRPLAQLGTYSGRAHLSWRKIGLGNLEAPLIQRTCSLAGAGRANKPPGLNGEASSASAPIKIQYFALEGVILESGCRPPVCFAPAAGAQSRAKFASSLISN